MASKLSKPFLIILLLLALFALYFILKPFLTEILVAAILASVFYKPYLRLVKFLKGKRHVAAAVMCILLLLVIIIPVVRIIIYGGQQSGPAYIQAVEFFNKNSPDQIFEMPIFTSGALSFINISDDNGALKNVFLDIMKETSNWLMEGATIFVKETTNFIVSLIFIIITMFFFFLDGQKMLNKLMYLSPLPNQYDREIFKKFKEVSYTGMMSTFVTAGAQGIVGAIGFAIVGFPALLAGILVALLSLLPYIGSMIFYIPVGAYYLLIGEIWQGIFVLLWGLILIGNTDNIIRTYMIQGKAQVNPIFIIFSILGGVIMFGFWGVVIGPLIIAIVATIFHIYEIEYCKELDKENCEDIFKEVKASKKELS
jgi:predicted PurR-regulated permease PerM